MQISTIGLDLAKNVFQVHGIDASGTGTVSVRLALWGLERRTRRRRCWLMSGRAAPGRAGTRRSGWMDHRGRHTTVKIG